MITEGGRVVGLEIEETRLERKGERISAVGTGEISRIPCDTVVFAVGDRVDERVGLPYREGLYVTAPGAEQDPAAAYQVWDPAEGQPLADVFVVGWARRASDGVVGRARLDAETGIKHILKILGSRPTRAPAEAERSVTKIMHELGTGQHRIDYHHVIWSLVRKPGAFAHYRYRDDLFPSLVFRCAYDALQVGAAERADRHYVRVLHLAATTSESEVETAIGLLLEHSQVPTFDAVRDLVRVPQIPALGQMNVNLQAYDQLVSSQQRRSHA